MSAKAPKIDINTDILRIDGKYFAVKRIQSGELDINKELKELYDKRFTHHVAQLNEGCVQTTVKDWNTQIDRLRSFEGKSAKTIPQQLFGKPVMIYRNSLLELRALTYAPREFTSLFHDVRFIAVRSKIREMLPNVADNETITVTVTPPFSIATFAGYCARTNTLYTPLMRTYHTFDDGRICTGNHAANDFWSLSMEAFDLEMNKVNLFSPANSTVHHNNRSYPLSEVIKQEMFVSARRRGDEAWNVSR